MPEDYISGIAGALNAFLSSKKYFPILVGMEQLDRMACEALAPRLKFDAPLFISDTYTMYDMVSVLRRCRLMVSSRFHAIVTSMPGLVASGGITMDERIRNLMNDRGHQDLFLEVDDPDLEARTLTMLERLDRDAPEISADIARAVPRQIQLMGQMGIDFADEVSRVYPDFPRRDLPRTWDAHLPELSPELQALLEGHA